MEQPRSLTLESLIKAQNKNNSQNGGKRSTLEILTDPSLQPGAPGYVPTTPEARTQQWIKNKLEQNHNDINVGPALNEYGDGAGLSPEVLDYFRNTNAPKLDGSGELYGPPERVNLKEAREKTDGYDIPNYSSNLDKVNIGSSGFDKPKFRFEEFKQGKHITPQTGEKFGPAFGKSQLRYPYETTQSSQDYIRFNIFKYERTQIQTAAGTEGKFFSTGIGDETVSLRDLLGSIILPVPAQIGDTNSVQYGESRLNAFAGQAFQQGMTITGSDLSELGDALTDAFNSSLDLAVNNRNIIRSKLVASAVSQLGANLDLNQVLARSSGEIINPNMELLFNSPALRQFKFRFKFTPRFEKETLEVKRIIKAFKKNMSPKGGATGALLRTPNIFQLQYVKGNGRDQGFLNKFKLCALQSASVNYTGDGTYATYYDGTPVSMTLDLSFQELSPVYNEDYDLRDNRGGVGF